MKISYSNYPILKKLHDGKLGVLPCLEIDKEYFTSYLKEFTENWKLYSNKFNTEINVISGPFNDATKKAAPKLAQLVGELDTRDFSIQQTCIIESKVHMLFYKHKADSEDVEICYYIFDKRAIPIASYVDFNGRYHMFISANLGIGNNEDDVRGWFDARIGKIVLLNLFKKYAEVETKTLLPNSKQKGIKCKYINDTKFKLNYLDSKWFTNLVKSDGFNVSGHFRLQPKKKNGEWTRELIWINEFQKTGYTAPARITAQPDLNIPRELQRA